MTVWSWELAPGSLQLSRPGLQPVKHDFDNGYAALQQNCKYACNSAAATSSSSHLSRKPCTCCRGNVRPCGRLAICSDIYPRLSTLAGHVSQHTPAALLTFAAVFRAISGYAKGGQPAKRSANVTLRRSYTVKYTAQLGSSARSVGLSPLYSPLTPSCFSMCERPPAQQSALKVHALDLSSMAADMAFLALVGLRC